MATAAELADLIGEEISTALALPTVEERDAMLADIASSAFALAYEDTDGPEFLADVQATQFARQMQRAIERTVPDTENPDTQAERISNVWAVAAVNAATVAAAPPGVELTWITRQDDLVRDTHIPMHGESRPVGQPFVVGGVQTMYPGQPVGPIENWINCRCVLAVGAITADGLVARTFTTEQREDLAEKGWAMPDGSYPIETVQDLRNAIQAIGRASDPDAVRRHIRKRARALDSEELIPDSWTAAATIADAEPLEPVIAAPANTHDGPGWVTNPRETQRLRNYWTRGEGAAKIRWGTEGDLTRCVRNLEKYVGPQWVWGTCQNLHHAALGYFNPESRGRRGGGDPDEMIDMIDAAFTAAATLEDTMLPPLDLFANPNLTGPTPMQVRAAGDFMEYVGHLATWDTCHVGMQGGCTTPPRSNANYAYFRTGEVETDGGPVAVGHITAGTGHASLDADPTATVAHYDDTGTVVADVATGEDEFGVWAHGIARPGVTEEQLYALRAGAPSGDWRRIGGNLELVGALIVNVPGFPIPRAQVASLNDRDMALVASGIVVADASLGNIGELVVAALDAREDRRARAAKLLEFDQAQRAERAERLLASMGS